MGVACVLFLIILIGSILTKISNTIHDNIYKKRNDYPDTDLYKAHDCNLRDKTTNELRFMTRKDGDLVTETLGGKVVRNLSEEQRKKEYEYLKEHHAPGETVYRLKSKYYDFENRVHGQQFKDLITGKIYVERWVSTGKRSVQYYMDIQTLNIIRPTDGWLLANQVEPQLDQLLRQCWSELPESETRYHLDIRIPEKILNDKRRMA